MKAIIIRAVVLSAALLAATGLSAGDKDKTSDKLEAKVVDAGSFGIYLDGKRIGTETFKIEQRPDYSIATAEIKVDDGKVRANQTAEMQITPKGELRSYIWRSTVPQREEATVEPKDQLLMEHDSPADQKKRDVPYLLPLSTVILDDNFFSQREILVWRYLATVCVRKGNSLMCGPGTFGVLMPRQHTSANVKMELLGPEKVTVKGIVRELNKVALNSSDPLIVMNGQKDSNTEQWLLWVTDPPEYKVIKITIPGTNVEVIRD